MSTISAKDRAQWEGILGGPLPDVRSGYAAIAAIGAFDAFGNEGLKHGVDQPTQYKSAFWIEKPAKSEPEEEKPAKGDDVGRGFTAIGRVTHEERISGV